jgi:hypothetical protein
VLFTRDAGLTVALRTLLPDEDRVIQLERPGEGLDGLDPGRDTVVLDFPRGPRWNAYTSIREKFPGRIVILLLSGEEDDSFEDDVACVLLRRPFQLDELSKELVVPAAGRRRGSAGARRGEPRPAPASPKAATPPPPRPPPSKPPASPTPWSRPTRATRSPSPRRSKQAVAPPT